MQRLTRAFEVGALALALAAAPIASTAADATGNALGARGSLVLKRAQSEGATTVTLIVASKPGQNGAVAERVAALGGTVRYREDDIDYLRVVIAIDKVKAVAALNERTGRRHQRARCRCPTRVRTARGARSSQPAPGAGTPRDNPYMPIGDIGAAQFMAAHPTWDGRGVTIGILDTGVTLDHPSLLTTSTGERKIIDWVTYTDPFDDDDPTWVDMAAQVSGRAVHVQRRRPTPRPPPERSASACSTSATRASAARSAATSIATAIPPAAAASSPCCGTRRRTGSGSTPTRTATSPTTWR